MDNFKQGQLSTVINFLDSNAINYTIINHKSEGKSEAVAAIRGTEIGQGAKALVCKIRGVHIPQYILAIIPGDQQVNFKKIAETIGVKKVSLASIDEVFALTKCIPGAVPPFSFDNNLKVIADPTLFERFDEIAFNAGSLETSIKMKSTDYLSLVSPVLLNIIKL